MNIKTIINEQYKEPELHVCNNEMNATVKNLVRALNELIEKTYVVKSSRGDSEVIAEKDITLIYTEGQHVFLKTASGTFQTPLKLYELEEQLDTGKFMRISRAEIINIKKISRLDMGLTGTIKVILCDGSECYTSRRNVNKLKTALGL